jgi:hypothetical protein
LFQNPEPIATRFALQGNNDMNHISTFSCPCNSTPAQISESATPALRIEHSVSADMADGQPLPPLIEDGVVWHVVRRTIAAAFRCGAKMNSMRLIAEM